LEEWNINNSVYSDYLGGVDKFHDSIHELVIQLSINLGLTR